MPIIHDDNYEDFLDHVVNGEMKSRGGVRRNYETHPSGYQAVAPTFDAGLITPEDQWPDLLAKQQEEHASLLDLRNANYETLRSLDQDGWPYCWGFSTTKAVMYVRALMN